MTEKLTGIILGRVKHSDKTNVVTLFTRERGREAFAVAAGNGRTAQSRAARLQLLSVVEFQVSRRPGLEMGRMSQIVPLGIWHSLYSNPLKTELVFFICDFLNRFLRHSAAETQIWDFIFREIRLLDLTTNRLGNFHLRFLLGIILLAGIEPDWQGWREGFWFDMSRAEFTMWKPISGLCLNPEESKVAARILRAGGETLWRLKLSRRARGRILDLMIAYIGVHYPGTSNLPSLEILRQL